MPADPVPLTGSVRALVVANTCAAGRSCHRGSARNSGSRCPSTGPPGPRDLGVRIRGSRPHEQAVGYPHRRIVAGPRSPAPTRPSARPSGRLPAWNGSSSPPGSCRPSAPTSPRTRALLGVVRRREERRARGRRPTGDRSAPGHARAGVATRRSGARSESIGASARRVVAHRGPPEDRRCQTMSSLLVHTSTSLGTAGVSGSWAPEGPVTKSSSASGGRPVKGSPLPCSSRRRLGARRGRPAERRAHTDECRLCRRGRDGPTVPQRPRSQARLLARVPAVQRLRRTPTGHRRRGGGPPPRPVASNGRPRARVRAGRTERRHGRPHPRSVVPSDRGDAHRVGIRSATSEVLRRKDDAAPSGGPRARRYRIVRPARTEPQVAS